MHTSKNTPTYVWVSQHWVEMTTQYGIFPVHYRWLDIQPSIDRYHQGRIGISTKRTLETPS